MASESVPEADDLRLATDEMSFTSPSEVETPLTAATVTASEV